jgi:phosphatidylglycerol---prolipoprotein diacylglyceryl transferase
MITWDLNPVALSLGPLEIRWYGIVYALGFFLGYYILRSVARSKRIPNLTEQLAEDYIFLLMMGSIIVSRLVHVIFYDPIYYLHNLLEIPKLWHGGLSIHGGLLGAIIVTWYFCKKHKINFYKIADLLVLPLAFAFIFGKITNYLNAELYGTKTNVSWCVQFPNVDGCRHPVQLYEALYGYVLFWTLFFMEESKRFADGVIFWTFILLYGTLRFFVNFYRVPEGGEAVLLGISVGQWLSLVLVVCALLWFRLVKKTGHPLMK